MDEIIRVVSENLLVAIAVIFAVLLLIYFLFKSLVKLVLILTLIAIAVGGYFYLRYPENRPANLKEAVQKVRTGAGRAVEMGKEVLEKGKEAVDKGKVILDKGMEKGKEVVEKGRGAAENAVKPPGSEKDAASRRGP
jgi:Cu/Ag efflux pump CusA